MHWLTRALVCAVVSVAGLASAASQPDVKFEVRKAESKPAEGLVEATVEGSKTKIYLHKEAALTSADVAGAKATVDAKNMPAISVTFTEEGKKKLAKLTAAHEGKPLAILVNGKVLAAPIVRDTITDQALITGQFSVDQAKKIAEAIQPK